MTLTLPYVVAGAMLIALNAYVLFGGADFGGGVWDFAASGPRRDAQRTLVSDAIGPIWEANHVWLIIVIVLLFTCFPPAFADLATVLHIPLALMLIGIVLRGSAFTFRTYDSRRSAVQRRWGRIFAIASLATPVLLGACIGAVASGRVGSAAAALNPALGPTPIATPGLGLYVQPWLTPFALGVGALALALFAFLAAVYLTNEAKDAALREDFRRRALASGVAVFVAGMLALLLARGAAPQMHRGLVASRWALPLHLATGVAAVLCLWALWTRRFRVARVAAAAQVSLILWGWAVAQLPFLVPFVHTIDAAAAPRRTLVLVLWALAAGSVILIPSLVYLMRVFKGAATAFERTDRGAE